MSAQIAPQIRLMAGPGLLLRAGAGLAAAAALEFLLLRIFTRTAIHIPGIQEVTAAYDLLAEAGRLGYFAATILLAGLLIALGAVLARSGSWSGRLAALAIAVFGVAAALAAAGGVEGTALALVSLAALAAIAPWATQRLPMKGVLPVGLYVAAFGLAALFAVGQSTADPELLDSALLLSAEACALAFAAAVPLLVRRHDRVALTVALGVGLVGTGLLMGNESTSKVLALWSVGLAGYFPAVAYGVALAGATYGVIAIARDGRPLLALGLVLLLMAGIGLHSTYQTGLAIVGLALVGSAIRLTEGSRALAPAGGAGGEDAGWRVAWPRGVGRRSRRPLAELARRW